MAQTAYTVQTLNMQFAVVIEPPTIPADGWFLIQTEKKGLFLVSTWTDEPKRPPIVE